MSLAEEIEKIVAPALAQDGVELVAVEYRREPSGWVLRFYLDREGGISLDDCAAWTDRLEPLIDQSGLVTHSYSLEVSSPGLNRPLRKREDFQRFQGIDAIIKLFSPLNNQRNYHGTLKGFQNDEVWLLDRTSGLVKLPFTAIASAKLDPPIHLS